MIPSDMIDLAANYPGLVFVEICQSMSMVQNEIDHVFFALDALEVQQKK